MKKGYKYNVVDYYEPEYEEALVEVTFCGSTIGRITAEKGLKSMEFEPEGYQTKENKFSIPLDAYLGSLEEAVRSLQTCQLSNLDVNKFTIIQTRLADPSLKTAVVGYESIVLAKVIPNTFSNWWEVELPAISNGRTTLVVPLEGYIGSLRYGQNYMIEISQHLPL